MNHNNLPNTLVKARQLFFICKFSKPVLLAFFSNFSLRFLKIEKFYRRNLKGWGKFWGIEKKWFLRSKCSKMTCDIFVLPRVLWRQPFSNIRDLICGIPACFYIYMFAKRGKKTKMFFDLLNFKISFVYGNTIFRKPAMKCVYSSLKCTELRYVEVRFSFLCRLLFRITKEVVCYFRYFQSCLKRFPT